ncbi:ABC transporter ATP-binding protein [Dysgonomonas capnocytophagoides]|uniref:ABC transporter ATP-binding protein n=1 Tax=Dysgonomonas capnocytophagoides TaxID=45254 RepID=UPI0029217668|nr:ABC transporter ATP-binding protein [Dysgonomonas capnocytophagoides]
MKKYWEILKRYKVGLLVSPLFVLVNVSSESIQPLFMARIIDEGVMERNLSAITSIGLYMLLVSVAGLAASIANIYTSSRTSIGFGTDLRNSLFRKIQELSFSDIDKFNSASLITRLTNDITKIQHIVLILMRIFLRAPLMIIMSVFFVVKINKELSLVLIAAIPILSISIYLILRKGFPLFVKVQQLVDRLNGIVRENLINIRVVKSFVREDFEEEKFTRSSQDLQDMVVRASNIVVSAFPIMQLIMNLSVIAILWFGGVKVIHGDLKVGELISFVNYLAQILISLMMLSMIMMSFARASASSKRILEVLDTDPSLANTEKGLQAKHLIEQGNISFRHVDFRHRDGDEDILKDINFHIRSGETIAIVGATGSAKSSMVQLIPRLYDATAGEVMINNINVKDYNLDELHNKIGMVLQKNELFTGSIIENIRWGKPDASQEEIEAAAKVAQAHDFIMSFTDGYDSLLGRGGVNVSGGQKQRICIARALIRKPKILILDDSTSAVDSDTEQRIRAGLSSALTDTTVLIITQRLNTMQSADRVIVLEDGRIEAIGTPSELIEKSKIYQEIYNSQQLVF